MTLDQRPGRLRSSARSRRRGRPPLARAGGRRQLRPPLRRADPDRRAADRPDPVERRLPDAATCSTSSPRTRLSPSSRWPERSSSSAAGSTCRPARSSASPRCRRRGSDCNDPVLGSSSPPLVGLALGLVNGFIITGLRVHSFLATLATSLVYRGIAILITGGSLIPVTDDTTFAKLGRGKVGDVIYAIVILAAVFAMLTFLARRMGSVATSSRRRQRRRRGAVGGARPAGQNPHLRAEWRGGRHRRCDQRVPRRHGSAQNGDGVALQAIAAIILGGTSVTGARARCGARSPA